jgi:alkaline phosphatase
MSFDGVDSSVCSDIAEQLIESELQGKNFKVILGGGRTYFLPNTVNDVESGRGRRLDGKNLVNQWQTNRPTGNYVTNRNELLSLNLNVTESILGESLKVH